MKESIVAQAYAKSIYALGEEQKIDVTEELTKLTEVINENNDLETVLFLDVFSYEEKLSVLSDVLEKLGTTSLVKNVISFLMSENRIGLLPIIFKEVVVIDDHKKGFIRGVIEGREDVANPEMTEKMIAYLADKVGAKPILTYKKMKI